MSLTVIVLERVPPGVRGDLSRWMMQPATGVFVGNIPTQVRGLLWERVCGHRRTGACVTVTSALNEQGYEIRQHGDRTVELIDLDGLALIRRPLPDEAR